MRNKFSKEEQKKINRALKKVAVDWIYLYKKKIIEDKAKKDLRKLTKEIFTKFWSPTK